jgi:opacity protein-like surface antigen
MKYLPFLLLTFASLVAAGQYKNSTSFGIKGGLNRSVIDGVELNGTKTGYVGLEMYFGFFADTQFNSGWNFESELLYSFTDEYHFIEMPLHIKFPLFKKSVLFFGPKIDLIVTQQNPYNLVNNPGVSIELGVQYDLTSRFIAELRYAKGSRKQINDSKFDLYDGKRNTLRLGVGFRFQ